MSNQIRTISPSTHEVIFDQPGASLADATKIAASSKQAFEAYRTTTLSQRKEIVKRALDIVDTRIDELAKELTTQMGRPIRYCAGEIKTMRLRAEHMMDIAEESLADLPGQPQEGFNRSVKRVPLGPVLIVGAWNVRGHFMFTVWPSISLTNRFCFLVPIPDYRQRIGSCSARW